MPPVEINSTPNSCNCLRKRQQSGFISHTQQRAFDSGHYFHCDKAPDLPPVADYNRSVPHYCTLIPGDGIGPEVAEARCALWMRPASILAGAAPS